MTALTRNKPTEAPMIVAAFKALPDEDQHRFLQLALRDFLYARDESELFLSQAAFELHPRDEDRQDGLYPIGGMTQQGWQDHYTAAARRLCATERQMAGRGALWDSVAPAFHGGAFGG